MFSNHIAGLSMYSKAETPPFYSLKHDGTFQAHHGEPSFPSLFGPPSGDTTLFDSHDCHLVPALSIRCSISPFCPMGVTQPHHLRLESLNRHPPSCNSACSWSLLSISIHLSMWQESVAKLGRMRAKVEKYVDNWAPQQCFVGRNPWRKFSVEFEALKRKIKYSRKHLKLR